MTKKTATEVRNRLESLVNAATHTAVLGSRYLNHLVMHNIEHKLQLPVVNQSLIRRMFARFWAEARSPSRRVEAGEEDADRAWVAANNDPPRATTGCGGFSTVLDYQARTHLTACHNHVKLNFRKRLFGVIFRRLQRWSLECDGINLQLYQFGKTVKALTALVVNALMQREEEQEAEDVYCEQVREILTKQHEELAEEKIESDSKLLARTIVSWMTETREKFLAHDPRAVAQVAASEEDWYKLLPWLWDMITENAAWNLYIEHAEDKNFKPARQFTLLPLCSTDAKFITVDTVVLNSLVKKLKGDAGEVTITVTKDSWDDVIRTPSAPRNWTAKPLMRTDGVTLESMYVLKKNAPGGQHDVDATPLETFKNFTDRRQVDLCVGVDPGRKDAWTYVRPRQAAAEANTKPYQAPSRKRKEATKKKSKAYWKKRKKKKTAEAKKTRHGGKLKRRRHDKDEIVYQLSTKEWRSRSGATQRQHQRVRWLQNIRVQGAEHGQPRTLYRVLQGTPTPKVDTAEDFLKHCMHICRYLAQILKHTVGERKVRRLRFQGYMQRVATQDEVCHAVTGGKEKTVVVFGAARTSTGWGHAPGPIMELRRRLEMHATLVVLHEHYTSRRCSKCAFNNPSYTHVHKDQLAGGARGQSGEQRAKKAIYGMRFCKHCGTRWNRDVNAARNIRQVFQAMVPPPHERPKLFKHAGALDGAPP